MSNRTPDPNRELLLEYGEYTVLPLLDPFEDKNGELMNYGIYSVEDMTCEAVTASMPQAFGVAISFDRALRNIADELDNEDVAEAVVSTH